MDLDRTVQTLAHELHSRVFVPPPHAPAPPSPSACCRGLTAHRRGHEHLAPAAPTPCLRAGRRLLLPLLPPPPPPQALLRGTCQAHAGAAIAARRTAGAGASASLTGGCPYLRIAGCKSPPAASHTGEPATPTPGPPRRAGGRGRLALPCSRVCCAPGGGDSSCTPWPAAAQPACARPAPVCSDSGPTMVKTTAGQRRLPPVPVCSPLPATNELNAGIAGSMDNEANVFDEMETRVTAMSSPPPRASVHCSLSSVTRSRHFVRPWLSAHSGIFSSSGWQRRLKVPLVSSTLPLITLHHDYLFLSA